MSRLKGKVAVVTGASKGIAVLQASDEPGWLTGERISASGGSR